MKFVHMFWIQLELIQHHLDAQNIEVEILESEDNDEYLEEFVAQDFENLSLLEDVGIKNHKENVHLNTLNQSSGEDIESVHQ
jgi:hypothetical protein